MSTSLFLLKGLGRTMQMWHRPGNMTTLTAGEPLALQVTDLAEFGLQANASLICVPLYCVQFTLPSQPYSTPKHPNSVGRTSGFFVGAFGIEERR